MDEQKEKTIKADILVFLFEQECKSADSDVVDWSVEKIFGLIKKHGEL